LRITIRVATPQEIIEWMIEKMLKVKKSNHLPKFGSLVPKLVGIPLIPRNVEKDLKIETTEEELASCKQIYQEELKKINNYNPLKEIQNIKEEMIDKNREMIDKNKKMIENAKEEMIEKKQRND